MLTTGAISAIHRPQGGICARKFAAAALLIFCLFAGVFASAPRASADTGIPSTDAIAAAATSAAEVSPVPAPVPSLETGNGAPAVSADPQQPAQDAATAQSATADAAAAQPQQSNDIASTRTDSSGGESASQENDVAVVGAAANDASTSQAEASGAATADVPPPPTDAGQQAATDQDANAAAAAVEPQQSNVVVIIRINSPGDDVVSQTNVVSVVAVGANQSSTAQNQNPAAAVGAAPGTTASPQTQSGVASAPSTGGQSPQLGAQPASSTNPKQQPAASVQQQRSQAPRALSILTFTASSIADAPSSGHLTVSTTGSTAPVRSGSADSPSRPFESSGAMGSSEKSVGSVAASVGTARRAARPTEAQSSSAGTLGAFRDHVSRWLGRTRVAARPQLTADPAGGMSLGFLTLTALLVGVLGWAALTWPPLSRR